MKETKKERKQLRTDSKVENEDVLKTDNELSLEQSRPMLSRLERTESLNTEKDVPKNPKSAVDKVEPNRANEGRHR